MSFLVVVTERAGMGISWDEEIPPRYEDIAWNAPPTFAQSRASEDCKQRNSMDQFQGIRRLRSRPTERSAAVYSSAGSFEFVRTSGTSNRGI